MSKIYGSPFATIPEWLLDSTVSDRAVRLFAMLTRYADKQGRAFPGRKTLAARLGCSPASLDRAIAELVEIEAIALRKTYRQDGGQTSNSYWLWPADPPDEPALDAEGEPHPGGAPLITGEEPPLFTHDDPKRNESQKDREPEDRESDTGFERFWGEYPRRVAKGDARKAWPAALAKAGSIEIIIAGAKRYTVETRGADPKFVAYPATWLRAERWGDEPGATRGRAGGGPRGPIDSGSAPEGRVAEL